MSARVTADWPRRPLLTADAVGGVWSFAIDLSGEIAAGGSRVVLAVLGPSLSPEQRREAQQVLGLEVIETGLPLDWTARSEQELRTTGAALATLARERRVDLAHVHAPALLADVQWPCPVLATVHSCVATWWREVRQGPLPEDLAWRARATALGLTRANALTAPSASFAHALEAVYGPLPRLRVVHNGRRTAAEPAAAREHCVITAGRLWDEGKNVAVLDRAARDLSAPFYAAGPCLGPNGERVRFAALRPLGVLAAEQVRRRIASAAVFVSPALYEPFGLAVLEAAQAGTPLVLSDIATFRELWDGAAVFVDPHDSKAFTAELSRLLDSPVHRARLGALARERARMFDLAHMAHNLRAVYRSLGCERAAA
jgi:glycosyltransferase involved in cell wall biosynthesis